MQERDNLPDYMLIYNQERDLLNSLWVQIYSNLLKEGDVLASVNWLKVYDPAGEKSLENLAEVAGALQAAQAGFVSLDVPVPDWMKKKAKAVQARAVELVKQAKEDLLASLKDRREQLKSPDEQRAEVTAEIERLEKELDAQN